ncbi:MAG: thiamine pyrophosphate-dependent dehydrogenase E1 component subunit alpha [Bdellovibrionota bacterium]
MANKFADRTTGTSRKVPKKKPIVFDSAKKSVKASASTFQGLPKTLVLQMHDLMVKSRVLEERLIKIYRAGESYFWIGGPGEEAWGVALGLLTNKGQGLEHDFLHLHYRCTPTLIAMGLPMIDSIRLMMNRATDSSTGGRNFSNHYCIPKWNIAPVTSPIEVQYPIAMGTAHAQKRNNKKAGKKAISIVTGGDAGTAEGDFASCLIWTSRKGNELPVLITVQNNFWGISTSYEGQHGEKNIADRARAFQMPAVTVNGNDPVTAYLAIQEQMEYVRREQKPAFIEAVVSRLYGHSSASGANQISSETCCIRSFEEKLLKTGFITADRIREIWNQYEQEAIKATEQVRSEPSPTADTVWDHTYANGENADWRKF